MSYKGHILEVKNLCLSLCNADGAPVRILNELTFSVRSGEILGLIGDSGSGKTMTALAISGLLSDFAQVDSGEIIFEDKNLLTLPRHELRGLQGDEIAVEEVLQEFRVRPLGIVGCE